MRHLNNMRNDLGEEQYEEWCRMVEINSLNNHFSKGRSLGLFDEDKNLLSFSVLQLVDDQISLYLLFAESGRKSGRSLLRHIEDKCRDAGHSNISLSLIANESGKPIESTKTFYIDNGYQENMNPLLINNLSMIKKL